MQNTGDTQNAHSEHVNLFDQNRKIKAQLAPRMFNVANLTSINDEKLLPKFMKAMRDSFIGTNS